MVVTGLTKAFQTKEQSQLKCAYAHLSTLPVLSGLAGDQRLCSFFWPSSLELLPVSLENIKGKMSKNSHKTGQMSK